MNPKKLNGKCHCGGVRYTIEDERKFEFLCHCSDCRVLNGGGHLSGIAVSFAKLEVVGKVKVYSYTGGSGAPIEMNFCSDCGTSVYAVPTAHEGLAVIRANTLIDDETFNPQKSLFPESSFLWDKSIIG